MRAFLTCCLIFPLSAWATPSLGDFSHQHHVEAPLPHDLVAGFDTFGLANRNAVINEEIDWSSYQSYGSVMTTFSGGFSYITIGGEWPNPPSQAQATYLSIPEVAWISGDADVTEVPIETDGAFFTQQSSESDFVLPVIRQEWTTDVTKLVLGGVEYDVYANVIPSATEFTDVSVDAAGHVYVASEFRAPIQTQPTYYRIDTEGLGQRFTAAELPTVTTHRVPAKVVETRQRLLSTKLFLQASAHESQQIRVRNLRFDINSYLQDSSETLQKVSVFQLGKAPAHGVAVDQLGDLLPVSGEIVPWDPSMAGTYVGTLVAGSEFIPRAPMGYGVIQSLTIGRNGQYSGVIQIGSGKSLRVRGKFSASSASSVSVELVRRGIPDHGARLSFMRMADGSVSLVARCYFGRDGSYYALGEKVLLGPSPLLGKHTLVIPNDQTANGISADVTGLMTIAKNSTAKILFRIPDGKAISLSTKVSAQGMVPILYSAGEINFVGRLRHAEGRALGDWTGGLKYSDRRMKYDPKYIDGICVGHRFDGWNPSSSSVTVHLEAQDGSVTSIAAAYSNGIVKAASIELKVNPDGSVRGNLQDGGKTFAITGVALTSQNIWTCSSSAEGMKKITVTGNLP